MTKALFFDIDGTLVSFETHAIPASTIEALTIAHEKGIKIFIATGRPKAIINNLADIQDRGLIDGYITMNGARQAFSLPFNVTTTGGFKFWDTILCA